MPGNLPARLKDGIHAPAITPPYPNAPASPLAKSANASAAAQGSAFDRVRKNLRNRIIGSLAGPGAQTGPANIVQKLRKSADSVAMSRGPHSDPTDQRGLAHPPAPDQTPARLRATTGGLNMSDDQKYALSNN
jgi:hypothetical protein